MTSKSECPREADLKRLMMHEMPDAEADRVARHLAECSRCAETVRLLNVDDTLADALHQPQPEVLDESDSVVVDGLIEQLRFLAHVRTLGSELSGSRSPRDTESEMRSVGVGPATPPGGSDARGEISPEAAAPPETYDFLEPAQGPDELGRLGPYRVLRVLGFGGMGVVFEAEDQQLARRVALKVMKPALAASDSARRRFLREARATAAIEHDHIVPIYHVGESRGMPFLAEQLLKGETLEDRLQRIEAQRRSETERRMETKRGSPGVSSLMPLAEVLRIGREIAEGLAAAHQRGLIHRDIKPANVWMQERVQGSGFSSWQRRGFRVRGSGFRSCQAERVRSMGFRVRG